MSEKTGYPSDSADKVLVRMPDGMRDRLKEAAKANNRTMNAEIVARLDESFSSRPAMSAAQQDIEMVAAALQNRSILITLRLDMLKLRQTNLFERTKAISSEAELIATRATTDAEFERSRAKITELHAVERESQQLQQEMLEIIRERDEVIQRLQQFQSSLSQAADVIEARVAAARASKQRADS